VPTAEPAPILLCFLWGNQINGMTANATLSSPNYSGFQDKANFPEGQASILQLVSSISPGGSLAKSLLEG